MKQLRRRIEHKSRTDRFTLYPIGDVHLGSAACDEALFKRTVNHIKDDPTAIVILMGDIIDGIGRTGDDFRYRHKTLAPWLAAMEDIDDVFDEEVNRAVALLEPIADKVVAFVNGNHEDKVEQKRGVNVYWSMVDRIAKAGNQNPADIAMGYNGFLRIRFTRTLRDVAPANWHGSRGTSWPLDIYMSHGFGGGKKPGSNANNMFDMMGSVQADLYLMGHTHNLMTVSKTLLVPTDKGMPRVDTRWGVVCGSFLQGQIEPSKRGRPRETYGELKGLPVLPTGHPVIHIEPGHGHYTVEMGTMPTTKATRRETAAR